MFKKAYICNRLGFKTKTIIYYENNICNIKTVK